MIERIWYKIGETAQLVGATPKELRYWERVIPELKPRRSKGNLRYYHQDELAKLQRIRQWLSEGFTVADCRELLRGQPITATKAPRPESRDVAKPRDFEGVLVALRALHKKLATPSEEPIESAPAAKVRQPKVKRPSIAPSAPLLIAAPEPEAEPESEPLPTPPAPKRARKPKPELSVLGRMWSEGRLPLDLDE